MTYLTVSVALCTFNCARFLPAQLASLLAQTRRPDELVVGDEASDDGTQDILRAFAATAPFPVRIIANPQRLGVAANFTQVIAACTGDVIALCDHDDVWQPTRLARSLEAFADPTVALSFSDATLIDAEDRPIPGRLWTRLGLGPSLARRLEGGEAFQLLLARRLATGGTMTLRSDAARWALPIPFGFFQDEWLATLAALRGRVQPIAEPLMQYRQHSTNAVGAVRDGFWARVGRARDGRRAARLDRHLNQLRAMQRELAQKPGLPADAFGLLAQRITHVEARLDLPARGTARVGHVWREWRSGRYRHDAMGGWSALQDLLG